jgi:hypothetical protein
MTESEWLSCTDLERMLSHLEKSREISHRKLRLFACACARTAWEAITDPRSRRVVEVGERFADGQASRGELAGAWREALTALPDQGGANFDAARAALAAGGFSPDWAARYAHEESVVREALFNSARVAASTAAWVAARRADAAGLHRSLQAALTEPLPTATWDTMREQARLAARGTPWARAYTSAAHGQCEILRDLVGNPFRRVAVHPEWLTWNNRTAERLARAIGAEGDFAQLPILGDALEEAGCTDQEVLGHCRRKDGHVRGCWLVDRLLGREGTEGQAGG